jgi:hypothetical protein
MGFGNDDTRRHLFLKSTLFQKSSTGKTLFSVTVVLIASNVLVFLLMPISSQHIVRFDGWLVLRWGGD